MKKLSLLTLIAVLLLCSGVWAQNDEVVEVDTSVTVETDGTVAEVETRGSLRDEYRRWKRDNHDDRDLVRVRTESRDDYRRSARVADVDAERAYTYRDRDDWEYTRSTGRYADYPEFDDDAIAADRYGDRMHDDYDLGSDRYWSRTYGDERYWDNRSGGSSCGCNKCSKGGCYKCGDTRECGCHKPVVKSCGKYGNKSKCGCHKPAVKSCGKCSSKSKCGCHKPAVKSRGKCGDKCSHRASKKCSKC